ncbi:Dyp-type peroxidase [Epidermidibacterium keratini]|uniref:Dyp-type peroxidase n=1 Tax=Epidermidibacterium keratini TaxID=1891644 RepID=A0A7L4YMC5_9ACTN|nr:Dyp-type peroxidase [Epidermidibacterium keratini]QHC00316.1 Dyp-type peroxidase [Epidermidibacterium keratini]
MVPQTIVEAPAVAATFMVLTVPEGKQTQATEVIGNLPSIFRSVEFREPEKSLNLVVGIGSDFYDRVYEGPRPAHLHPFEELKGDRHTAPSTPGDLLLHIRAVRRDVIFELADLILREFGDAVEIADSTDGFRYFDDRDLLGFVDGSENPRGQFADDAVLVGDADPHFAGSSYVIVQKYLHDLDAWRAQSVEAQEDAIGRTKLENIEFPDDKKAADSHVKLNTIHAPDGRQLKIVRDNMPFSEFSPNVKGTYFIGYAADPGVTEQMLRHMFIGNPPGTTDRILDFSTAKTGCLFFVPTQDFLDNQPLKGSGAGSGDSGTKATTEKPAQAAKAGDAS